MLEHYDSSSLKCYLECPRKFYWRYVEDLVLKHKPSYLRFGTAIHEALYTWYKNQGLDFDKRQDLALDRFHEVWSDDFSDDKRTHERGDKLLKGYFDNYYNEPFRFLSSPEQSFKISIGEYEYTGRFDGVIQWNEMTLVLDHKTSSRMGKSYFKRYRPDLQMTGYCWAAQQLFDTKVEGALINVLYNTKTKQDYIREIISREQWEIDQFASIVVNIMDEVDALPLDDHKQWQPNWTSCMKWGACDYRDLCLSQSPDRVVDTMYEQDSWNPLAERDYDEIKDNKPKLNVLY